ncbi:HEAT repeat domain-containing protein [Streptomyces sp. CB03238]|uniref:HEAT repeat domain-containing protein n=1 Tax=Streptomyces sp. CB03238 TaxID=1907777 RepID=UPI0015C4A5CE|nr:HEAT repeat domain-containing protein [Streptomyces sp. CB03238]
MKQRYVNRMCCDTCWQRGVELEAEAEARFRRANPVDEVCTALRDGDVSVRRDAAHTLERLRDPRAVDPLFDALGREDVRRGAGAAHAMIEALAAIGGSEVGERLLGLLHNEAYWTERYVGIGDEPPMVTAVDCVNPALFTVGGSELMLRGLLDVLGHQEQMLRWYAARELANITYRSTVGYGLTVNGSHGELVDADRQLIVGPLRSALRDKFWLVRESAATALGHLGDRSVLDDLLACLADDHHHRVRYFAAKALGDLGDASAVEPLRRALSSDVEISVAVKEALAKLVTRS